MLNVELIKCSIVFAPYLKQLKHLRPTTINLAAIKISLATFHHHSKL
jgi:hypothetical protein